MHAPTGLLHIVLDGGGFKPTTENTAVGETPVGNAPPTGPFVGATYTTRENPIEEITRSTDCCGVLCIRLY